MTIIKHEFHRLAFGCMGLGGRWNERQFDVNHFKQAWAAIETALDVGIRFFDHADIYARGKAELVFGEVLKSQPGLRESLVIQTKCGVQLPGDPPANKHGHYDLGHNHILHRVDESLKRLQVENIDLLLLHRPDPLVEPEEVARAFEELKRSGKVKEFGVSNHTPAQMSLLQKFLPMPLSANQMEFHLLHCDMIDGGISGRLDLMDPIGTEGTIEFCRIHGIRIQAWSPVAKGLLSGQPFKGRDQKLKKRIENCGAKVRELAKTHGVSREAVVISWILRHPARILPILGSKTPQRIRNCAEALNLKLSREEWNQLYRLGRGANLP